MWMMWTCMLVSILPLALVSSSLGSQFIGRVHLIHTRDTFYLFFIQLTLLFTGHSIEWWYEGSNAESFFYVVFS